MALPKGPGWEWNPGATFVTAFNNAQENKRRNEEMEMDKQLSAILFPAKKAQAEFTIKQLAYESSLLENSYKSRSAELEERYRLIKSGGLNQAVSGSGGDPGSQESQTRANPFMIDTTGANFNPTTTTRAPNNSRTVVLPTE